MAALIVSSKDQRFAIPQVAVLELVRVTPQSEHSIERINGTPVMRLRDRLLPIVPLSQVLRLADGEGADEGFVVVTQVGRERFGILVDGVFHTEEIVVKPMSSKLRHIQLFSGNTILGDGAVVLIIDPNGLARMVGSGAGDNQFQGDDPAEQAGADEDEVVTLLVFRGGGESLEGGAAVARDPPRGNRRDEDRVARRAAPRAVPRAVSCRSWRRTRRSRSGATASQALVVFSDGERTMGLAVDEIVDIVDDKLDIELVAERSDLVGSAVIRGRATEVVNVAHYLPLAHDDWARPAAARTAATDPLGSARRRLGLLPRHAHAGPQGFGIQGPYRSRSRRGARSFSRAAPASTPS